LSAYHESLSVGQAPILVDGDQLAMKRYERERERRDEGDDEDDASATEGAWPKTATAQTHVQATIDAVVEGDLAASSSSRRSSCSATTIRPDAPSSSSSSSFGALLEPTSTSPPPSVSASGNMTPAASDEIAGRKFRRRMRAQDEQEAFDVLGGF